MSSRPIPGFLLSMILARALSAATDDGFIRTLAATRNFSSGRPAKAAFTPDGGTVLFLRSGPRDAVQELFAHDLATGTTRSLLDGARLAGAGSEQLSAAEKARRERQRVGASGVVGFEVAPDGRHLLVPFSGKLHWFDRVDSSLRELAVPGPILDPRLSPDGKSIAYVRDHDVWTFDIARGRATAVTRGGNETVSHGEAEFVAQEEMYRPQGYWWSPDGRRVAFEESDTRDVEVWQVGDPMSPGRPPAPQAYPRPGKANAKVRLGIAGATGGRVIWARWDVAKYPYLARVDWHKEGGLTACVQTRDQRELVLLRIDSKDGSSEILHAERDDAWVNIDPAMPRWLRDGRHFLWTSERSGEWELEVRDATGGPARVLVGRGLGWQGLAHLDEDEGTLWFHASTDPTQQHLWRVPLAGGECTRATEAEGVHGAVFAKHGGRRLVTSSTPAGLAETRVLERDGREVARLPSVAEEPGFVPRAEFATVGAAPGYHAKIVRPRDFVVGRKYPVIVDVYGGPHAQVVRRTLASSLVDQWLADQGFVVVAADGRGTPGRGRDWERAIAGRLGEVPLEGQAEAIAALAARFPEMDATRVGITGWSFGGYLSVFAVLNRPDVFHAAVAGAPVIDWEDYDTHYTERYLGVPPAAADAYRRNSCLTRAAELKRPLLLVHGTRDDNVFFRHTLRMTDALVRAGRRFEVLPLPGFTHMVTDPVVAGERWRRTVEFFRANLGP